MIGAVGTDAYGDEFMSALEREGVDATRMVRLSSTHTSVAAPLVTPDGDVGFVHAPGANHVLTPGHIKSLPDCDILLLQGEVPPETSLAAAIQARQMGARVLLNPAPVHHSSSVLLEQADIVCPNQIEAAALLRESALTDLLDQAVRLSDDRRITVITLGARGAVYASPTERGEDAPPGITAVDATAAGDSFCAALALALVEGMSLADAVRFACAAGAHAATVRGAEPGLPTRADVEGLLR